MRRRDLTAAALRGLTQDIRRLEIHVRGALRPAPDMVVDGIRLRGGRSCVLWLPTPLTHDDALQIAAHLALRAHAETTRQETR